VSKIPSPLEIQLFGIPQVLLNGKHVDGLRRKNRALIYYIAAQERRSTRDKILAFFWPDHERSAAQPILRNMIHEVRKYLGNMFQADDQVIAFAPDTFVDAQFFSATLNSRSSDLQQLIEALNLYKGDFLDGFTLSNSPQFEDWVVSERERYRLMAMKGFADLSHRQETKREYPAALESIRRALAFNPFQEDVQRDVMRLLYLNGDRAGVIQHYEFLRKLLDEEMGMPPMPETRALYDSIINDTFAPAASETLDRISITNLSADKPLLPLLGRDVELETLKSQLGSGKLIVLEGEPGIGKTRLISELISSQTQGQTSAFVLQGISYELEQGLPYQPIVDALRKLLTHPEGKSLFGQLNLEPVWQTELSHLLPELLTQVPAPTQPADERRLWEALHQFIRALTQHGEVWLFLDDLHWADASTISWLGYLVRRISSQSLHLLATSRPLDGQTDLIKLLQALNREDRLVQIQLSVLPESVMQKMAVTLSQQHNEQLSDWLIKHAEGNPFFVTELIRYARGSGLLKQDGSINLDLLDLSPTLPATIQNLIESRLLKLSENAQHILHIAAVIGRKFDFELVRQAGSLSEAETLNAVDELQTAHLINPLPDEQFAFDHSLTMEVVLTDMNETRRCSLHRHVAEALETIHKTNLDPVSGLITRHFIDGNASSRARIYAMRAGRYAASLAAWVEALAFYNQALELETVKLERAPIFLAMGDVHYHKGDFALASKDYQSAIELASLSHDWHLLEEAHLGLNLSFFPQARFAEAVDIAQKLRASGPPGLAVCAEFMWGTSLSIESAHPAEAEYHLHEAERLLRDQAETFDTKVTGTQIKYQLGSVLGQQGRDEEAMALFRDVLDMLERGEGTLDTLRNIMLYNHLAYQGYLLGDTSAAMYAQAGIKLAQERGSLSHLPYLYSTSGEIALANGDLDAAEKYFRDGLTLAEQTPIPERVAGLTANLGLVAKARGQSDVARDQLQKALHLAESVGNHHLEVRIRIWLAATLAATEARACLNAARVLAERDGLKGLLEEIQQLEKTI
jgi:DNA-binding SARP family transcriptional activator/tetratricopeptide (TPR) repeat protein